MASTPPPIPERYTSQTSAEEFDPNKVWDVKGFAEFLAAHPDAETFDDKDTAELEKRFNAFKIKESVKKEVGDLYANQIQSEMGIRLDDEGKKLLADHFEKLAIEDPEELEKMKTRLYHFKEQPKRIKELEQKLAGMSTAGYLNAKIEIAKTDKENMEIAKEYFGASGMLKKGSLAFSSVDNFMKKSLATVMTKFGAKVSDETWAQISETTDRLADVKDARDAIKSKYGDIGSKDAKAILASVNAEIANSEVMLAKVQGLEMLKKMSEESFANMRKDLMGGIAGIAGMKEYIQEKVMNTFKADNIDKIDSFKTLNKVNDAINKLKQTRLNTETGIDPLASVDMNTVEGSINKTFDDITVESFVKAIENSKLGTNALTNLEDALIKSVKPISDGNRFGNKVGEEAREKIIELLQEAVEGATDPATIEGKAKRLIVKKIISKISA